MGFISAASFVGHLVESGVLDRGLVRRHLIKPLINHHYTNTNDVGRSFRAMAIYELFVVARSTLLQGLLDPEDVQACFEMLSPQIHLEGVAGMDAGYLSVRGAIRSGVSCRDLTCLIRIFVRSTPLG